MENKLYLKFILELATQEYSGNIGMLKLVSKRMGLKI